MVKNNDSSQRRSRSRRLQSLDPLDNEQDNVVIDPVIDNGNAGTNQNQGNVSASNVASDQGTSDDRFIQLLELMREDRAAREESERRAREAADKRHEQLLQALLGQRLSSPPVVTQSNTDINLGSLRRENTPSCASQNSLGIGQLHSEQGAPMSIRLDPGLPVVIPEADLVAMEAKRKYNKYIESLFDAVVRQCRPYNGDGKISPERFVRLFDSAIANRDIPPLEQARFFIRLVKVNDPAWAGGLPNENDGLKVLQHKFLEFYWNKDIQQLALREFAEAKFSYRDGEPAHLIAQLDNWHTRLTALTYSRLSTEEIINKMIEKMPANKRDLLRVGRCETFTAFKSLVINVVHARDFKEKEMGGSKNEGGTHPKENSNRRGGFNSAGNSGNQNQSSNFGRNIRNEEAGVGNKNFSSSDRGNFSREDRGPNFKYNKAEPKTLYDPEAQQADKGSSARRVGDGNGAPSSPKDQGQGNA